MQKVPCGQVLPRHWGTCGPRAFNERKADSTSSLEESRFSQMQADSIKALLGILSLDFHGSNNKDPRPVGPKHTPATQVCARRALAPRCLQLRSAVFRAHSSNPLRGPSLRSPPTYDIDTLISPISRMRMVSHREVKSLAKPSMERERVMLRSGCRQPGPPLSSSPVG